MQSFDNKWTRDEAWMKRGWNIQHNIWKRTHSYSAPVKITSKGVGIYHLISISLFISLGVEIFRRFMCLNHNFEIAMHCGNMRYLQKAMKLCANRVNRPSFLFFNVFVSDMHITFSAKLCIIKSPINCLIFNTYIYIRFW